jgi:hypothetical protein
MRFIKKGAASQTLYFDLLDTSSTTGGRKTGLAFNSGGLTAYYTRNGAAPVAVTPASQTPTGAWASGGFAEVDATNAPGLYRLDVPNAAFASGADSVVVGVSATGAALAREQVQLVAVDLQDATALGLSRLDAAVTSRAVAGDAMTLTTGERSSVADAFLDRNLATGTDSGSPTVRTVRQALRFLRNKWAISSGALTVYKEDDTTTSWSSTMATDGAAVPIISSDPA